MRALFVDDEEGIRELAKIHLEDFQKGLEVVLADSATNALEMLDKEDFDVVVADYVMPEIDGLELLRVMRGRGDMTPFILLTGRGMEEVAMEALNLGANRYFKKIADPQAQYRQLAKAISELNGYGPRLNISKLPDGVREIILDMLGGTIKKVEPSLDLPAPNPVRYPDLERYPGVRDSEIQETLELLAEEDFLIREFIDKRPVCPTCGSDAVVFLTECPFCGSRDLWREEMIEHLGCGFTGPANVFDKGRRLICPQCHETLKAIGVDYARMTHIEICQECGHWLEEPGEVFRCHECFELFPKEDLAFERIYSYRLNPRRSGRLRLILGQ